MVDRLTRVARWRLQRAPAAVLIAMLAVGVLALLTVCVYVLPQALAPDRSAASLAAVPDAAKRLELEDARLKQRNDVRTTLLQGLAGGFVAVGLSLTWRQIRVNQEGQITERFAKAIDHVGSDKLDLRLGGIYALERIAKNSNDDRDTIAEVLTAFVRQRSPWPPSQPGQYIKDAPIEDDLKKELRVRAPDVQAALSVLGRRTLPIGPSQRLDLSATDLRGADLTDARLQKALLERSRLQEADLRGAQLQGARLRGARLQGASLIDAQLQKAYLVGAQLEEAKLRRAQLQGAVLGNARLKGAQLFGAQLQEAHVSNAQLQGALCDAKTVWPNGFNWKAAGVNPLQDFSGWDRQPPRQS
jgi:hypothetical protein